MNLKSILGRSPYKILTDHDTSHLKGKRILITGASGQIGKKLSEIFLRDEIYHSNTDIHDLDVTKKEDWVSNTWDGFDLIIHLAGAKHAPLGEIETENTFNVNTIGTINALNTNIPVLLASTCKACNPETAYGASKLIAERLVLNKGGHVVRFYNVVETDGNVFEIWKDKEIIEVAEKCERYFISLDESVGLILEALKEPSGRYAVNKPVLQSMEMISKSCYPDKEKIRIKPRKGDRLTEKLISTSEFLSEVNEAICKIISYHD